MNFAHPTRLFAAALLTLVLLTAHFAYVGPALTSSEPPPQTGGEEQVAPPLNTVFVPLSISQSALEISLDRPGSVQFPDEQADLAEMTAVAVAPEDSAAEPILVSLPEPAVEAAPPITVSPEFMGFIETVSNGEASVVRGAYVEGVLALPVIQQPSNNVAFVSTDDGIITQFQSAAYYGVTGLLAHNYLSGGLFYNFQLGQEVRIVYGDGSFRRYQITDSHSFQKLNPGSLQSELIDLETGQQMTASQVFDRVYRGEHHVTFQTCLERNGLSNWGLTFWTAVPITP